MKSILLYPINEDLSIFHSKEREKRKKKGDGKENADLDRG
jgi:hypothetical protein